MFRNILAKAKFSTSTSATPAAPEKYNAGMQFFHWGMGGAIMACLGLVQYKQSLPAVTDEEKKVVGNLMMYHKSFGLIVSGLMVPRILTKIVSKAPPGPSIKALSVLSKVSHWGMYGLVSFLCISGINMGYQSGYGVPFFGIATTPHVPVEQANGPAAQYAFKLHKYCGVALEYAVALHVAGFAFHLLTGHNLLTRLNGPVGSIFMAMPWIAIAGAVAYSTKPDKLPEFKNWMSPPDMGPVQKKD